VKPNVERRRSNVSSKYDEWKAGLSPSELRLPQLRRSHIVASFKRGLVGGCYLLAFFLYRYLQKHGIETRLIVGWVHDGESDAMPHTLGLNLEERKLTFAYAHGIS